MGVQAMKHLMIKRPLDANRLEFFAHAEAFAALVQLDFVLVPGIAPKFNAFAGSCLCMSSMEVQIQALPDYRCSTDNHTAVETGRVLHCCHHYAGQDY